MLKIIIGLGNPGTQYDPTRHNAGFWLLDALAAEKGVNFSPKKKFKADVATCPDGTVLFKPQTFMNLSGETAIAATNFYQSQPEQVLVIHDEVDLATGQVKLKHGGGDAGHRGLADITRRIGKPYWRMRLGVGKPAVGGVRDYVLQKPSVDERALIDDAIHRSLNIWHSLVAGDFENAMHVLHTGNG